MTVREICILEDYMQTLSDDVKVAFDNYHSYLHNDGNDVDLLHELWDTWDELQVELSHTYKILHLLGYQAEMPRNRYKISKF